MVRTMSSHGSDTSDSEPEDLLSSWLDQLSLSRGTRDPNVQSDSSDAASDDGSVASSDSLSTVTEAQAMTAGYLSGQRVHSSPAQKLRLLQALLVEFRVCAPETITGHAAPLRDPLVADYLDLPSSIVKCTALIRANIHINIKKYLELKHAGKATGGLKRYSSRSALAKALAKNKQFVVLSTAKAEMLNALLVSPRPQQV